MAMTKVLPPKTNRVNAGRLCPSTIPAKMSLNLGMTVTRSMIGITTMPGEMANASRMR